MDMVTSMVVGAYFHFLAEKLSFLIDVMILRQRPDKREKWHLKPCTKCGWSNRRATNYVSLEEKELCQERFRE
jgi:hypothetical protein